MRIIIKNGQVVDPIEQTMTPQDILIENGYVAQIASEINESAQKIIDATGLIVAPALVDMHVHLREPGQTHKEDIVSAALSAARGGICAMACMPNTNPILDTPEQMNFVKEKAKRTNGVRVFPIAAVTKNLAGKDLTDFEALKEAGAVALSDDGNNVDSAYVMRSALKKAKTVGMTILAHCEDSTLAKNLAVNEGHASKVLWMEGRPAIAEELMVMRDIMLAEETGSRVHICHISTGKSVDMIRKAKRQNIPVTCETCPQYFSLSEDEILGSGPLARVNPPLRSKKDMRQIQNGLKDGTIDVIATDHAPHTLEEKSRSLMAAPSGMAGLETSLSLALTNLYHTGKMYLPQLFHAMSTKPAQILGIEGGVIQVGKPADIVIFNVGQEWAVNPDVFASKAKNSPFRDHILKGRIKCTLVDGVILHEEGPELPPEVALDDEEEINTDTTVNQDSSNAVAVTEAVAEANTPESMTQTYQNTEEINGGTASFPTDTPEQ